MTPSNTLRSALTCAEAPILPSLAFEPAGTSVNTIKEKEKQIRRGVNIGSFPPKPPGAQGPQREPQV